MRNRLRRLRDVPVLLCALVLARVCGRRRSATGTDPKRVLHVITRGTASAERQLAALLARTPPSQYRTDVVVLERGGREPNGGALHAHATVRHLTAWPSVAPSLWALFRLCRRERYEIVHTWGCSANVVGVCAARLAGTPRVITSVRNMSLGSGRWGHDRWFRVADALASRASDVVTVNAHALVADHARWARYPAHRIEVVPDGLDLETMAQALIGAGDRLRTEFSIHPTAVVVGSVGRLAHEKDQATFLRILARLRWAMPQIRGVIVGAGPMESALRALAREVSVDRAVVFAGERPDARRLIAGLDLLIHTSMCEGLPNVLLEAALLNVPCVATDVGGVAEILGNTGALFSPGDDWEGYVRARRAIETGRPSVATTRVRRYVRDQFSEARMARAWLALYGEPGAAVPATPEERAVA